LVAISHSVNKEKMINIFWSAYCIKGRYEALAEIERIIDNHGFITDFKEFSNISLMLKIECEERKIDALYSELAHYMTMDQTVSLNSNSLAERVIFMNVSFPAESGNMRVEVPAVPG